MRRQITTKVTLYLSLIISLVLFSTLAYAQDAPAPGAFFYGKATVNGKPAPVSSFVVAKIGNEKRGQIKVTAAGAYGSETTDAKLGVAGTRSTIGKDIQFYVKILGFKEIKATQTFKWQSGEVNKLDLTFIGEEIVDNSSDANYTEQIEIFNGSRQSFFYERLTAGQQLRQLVSNPALPIVRLQLVTKTNLSNVTIEFDVVDAPDAPKLENVYKYISINAPKIKDSDVQTAILRFRIPNDWFKQGNYDPATVKLLRYNGNKWNELETLDEGADSEYNYYRASTPGFSYFAIRAEKALNKAVELDSKNTPEADEVPEEEAEEAADRQQTVVNQITGAAVEKVKANPVLWVVLVLVGMLVGIALTYLIVIRKREY